MSVFFAIGFVVLSLCGLLVSLCGLLISIYKWLRQHDKQIDDLAAELKETKARGK